MRFIGILSALVSAVVTCQAGDGEALQTLLDEAEAAEEGTDGRVVDAEIVLEKGHPVIRVTLVADGEVHVVRVDGKSGDLLDADGKGAPKAKEAATDKKSDKPKEGPFTDRFTVADDEWASTGRNPWFILEPGYVLVIEGEEDGKTARLTITVLDETEEVDGIETRGRGDPACRERTRAQERGSVGELLDRAP